jgi:hypothetical protein
MPLAVAIGTGLEYRRSERVGFQSCGSQHAALPVDFSLCGEMRENALGNYPSLGGGVVIRQFRSDTLWW